MHKWEYKVLHRVRGVGVNRIGGWDEPIVSELPALGDEGWELVTVITRSSEPGSATSGVTSDEMWVFKRLKSSARSETAVITTQAVPQPAPAIEDMDVITRAEAIEHEE
ncbi:MAG TPA: hypothetical protein VFV93_16765 [Thermomicrobiales bacterium]|nr:hypothetical protein [Thermomicrobiales bacterium]